MNLRRVAIILAAAVVLLAGGTVIYLKANGVQVWALITARQTPALPEGKDGDLSPNVRPGTWAQAIQQPGLPNLHKVTDDLYRGAQPTAEGLAELKKLGIKTVINLRTRHSDETVAKIPDLDYEQIAVEPWGMSTDEAARFLKIVTDKTRTPVYVHCQYGADRTGAACAVFRVTVQGWTKDEALREMTRGGFGYHEAWANLLTFVHDLDVDTLRRQAGLPQPPAPRPTDSSN
jgi:protein tyrosine phosphatase (PTP) superfamily phosphohydrolase (DUF442 family)